MNDYFFKKVNITNLKAFKSNRFLLLLNAKRYKEKLKKNTYTHWIGICWVWPRSSTTWTPTRQYNKWHFNLCFEYFKISNNRSYNINIIQLPCSFSSKMKLLCLYLFLQFYFLNQKFFIISQSSFLSQSNYF